MRSTLIKNIHTFVKENDELIWNFQVVKECGCVIACVLSCLLKEPERGNVVIFTSCEKGLEGEILLKRIVDVPGNDLMFVDGDIYLNGQLLKENYLPEGTKTYSDKDFEVPDDSYFVMGDNRENSYDFRCWEDPFVKGEETRGKIVLFF